MHRSVQVCLWTAALATALCGPAAAARLSVDAGGLDAEQKGWLRDCRKGDVDACVALGGALAQAGRHAEALAVLSSVELTEGSALALYAAELEAAGRTDETRAVRDRACDLGHAASCLELAGSYPLPEGLDEALTAWSKACQHGAPEGCSRRAHALRDALRVDQAILAFQRLCPDDPDACARAGELLMVRGRHGEAARVLAKGALEATAPEALLPGHLELLDDDPGGADQAYLAACEDGARAACVALAELRLRQERPEEALAAYELSCDACAPSCLVWGDLLAAQDRVGEALNAYGRACVVDRCSDGCGAAVALARGARDPSAALDQMTVLCRMEGAAWGDSPATAACYDAGVAHQKAGRVDLAGELFTVGCDAGDLRSCKELLAKLRRKGAYDAAAVADTCLSMGSGCVRGGLLHEAGRDAATAETMFRTSCDVGISAGCQALAALMQRQGRRREAAAVLEKAGLAGAGAPDGAPGSGGGDRDGAAFEPVARLQVVNGTGQAATLADLRGAGILVLALVPPWPACYPAVATLARLPGDLDGTPLAVVALAAPPADEAGAALATRAAGSSLILRFAAPDATREALSRAGWYGDGHPAEDAGGGVTLWVVDAVGRAHPVEGPLVIGDDEGLLVALRAALGS